MADNLGSLYGAVSQKFDVGSEADFRAKMQTSEDRKKFYDAVSGKGFDLGDYNAYETRLGEVKKKEPTESTTSVSAEPVSQDAKPLEQVGTDDILELPKSYQYNRNNKSELEVGKAYQTTPREIKRWTGDHFEKNPDASPLKSLVDFSVKGMKGIAPEAMEKLDSLPSGIGDKKANIAEAYRQTSKVQDEAAGLAMQNKLLTSFAPVQQLNQLNELYAIAPEDKKVEIQKKIDELANRPITNSDFVGTRFSKGDLNVSQNFTPTIKAGQQLSEYDGGEPSNVVPEKIKTVGDAYAKVKQNEEFIKDAQAESFTLNSITKTEQQKLLSPDQIAMIDAIPDPQAREDEFQKQLDLSKTDAAVSTSFLRGVNNTMEGLFNVGKYAGMEPKELNAEMERDYYKQQLFSVQPEGLAAKTAEGIGGMVPDMALSLVGGTPAMLASMSARHPQEALKQYYFDKFGKGETPDYNEAWKFATTSTAINTSIFGGASLFGGGAMPISGTVKQAALDFLSGTIKNAAKDAAIFGLGGKAIQDLNSNAYDVEHDNNYIQAGIEMGVFGGVMYGLTHAPAIIRSKWSQAKINKAIDVSSFMPPDVTAKMIQDGQENGFITPQEATEIELRQARVRQIVNQFPKELTIEQIQEIEPLWAEKDRLSSQMKEASPVMKKILAGKISELDEKSLIKGAVPLTAEEKAEYKDLITAEATEGGKADKSRLTYLRKRMEAASTEKESKNKADAESSKGGDGGNFEPHIQELADWHNESKRIKAEYDKDWDGLSEQEKDKIIDDNKANLFQRDRLFDDYATDAEKKKAKELADKKDSFVEKVKEKIGIGTHYYDRMYAEHNFKEDVVQKLAKAEADKQTSNSLKKGAEQANPFENSETTKPTFNEKDTSRGDGEDAKPEAETGVEAVAENGKEEVVAEAVEPTAKETKPEDSMLSEGESKVKEGSVGVGGDKKTNTVNGYEFTKTPTLENVTVELIDKSNNVIIEKQMFADENKNVLAKGVKYIGGGWYEIGGDNFGSVDLYNTVTKEGVSLNHKHGGRTGVVVQDFIKNNSRYNDNIAVRGSKFTQEEHNPKFGGSGHYKGTYFYVGLSAESKALEHGKNLTKVDIENANLYELGEDGQTSQSLKNEAKKAGYDTRDASGYAESEYLKKQGYDGIKRGNEIVLFEPKKFEVKEKIADLPNVSGGTVKQPVPERGATAAFISKYSDTPLQMARREKYLDSAVMSNGKQTTERKLIEERVKQGWRVTKMTTDDAAASKKINQEYERLKRTAPIGNENHPETKRLRELEKMPKSLYNEREIAVKKEELRLESPEGTTTSITPFGEDYVNELLFKEQSIAIKFLDNHTVDGPIQKYDLHPDFELSSEEIARGTKQIRNGEFDKAGAKKMLAKIDEWKRQGYVDYIRGSGKQMQKTSVPFELTEAMAQLPKEKAEAVKELHDKVEEIIPEISDEEAQSQVDKILATFTDENGNIDFKRIAEEYKGWNPAILELSAKADELLKSKIDESRANQKDATEGSTKADTKGGDSGEGGIKKTIVTKRAYEGEFREGVKKELERIGLTREVESQAEAKNKAKEFVDSVGEEAALDAVRNNDIQDAGGAYVWNELIERNQKKMLTETDPAKISDLESEQANLIEEFGRKALSGGRFSSALGDIYEKSDLGYNLQKKIADYKEQNGGVIPIEIEAKFREYDKQLKEISTRLAEAEQRAKEAEEKRAIENIKEEVAREKKKSRPIVYGKKRIAKGLDDLASALGARLSATGEEAVKVTDALTEIGRGLIEEGIATGENVWQKVKEYVSDKFGDKLKDIDSYEKDVKEKIEGGRTYGNIKIPKSLIKELVARGINNIDELTAAVKERVKDEYPNASDREIRDAITGYGKMSNLNQGEIETQIRKIARAGKIISALEDIAKKKRPLRSGAQRDKLDADERAMQKQLREAMKGLPVDEGAEAQQLKTQLDAAKQRVKNQIDDLEREINNGELVPKDSRTVKEDAELKSLKEKRDELKKEHDAIFKDEEFKQARRLELTKKANERRLDELKKKLREGDFSKKERKPLIADDELIKLKAEKLRIQEQYDVEFYKNKLANRTTSERWKDRLWEIWSLPRALMATGEWSFVGVQGLKLSLSHPQYAAQAFKNAWKSMLSEKKTAQFLNEIKSQEWYPTMKNSKLSLTEPHAEVTAREETFNSSWSNLVWNLIGYPTKYVSDSAYDKWISANPMKALERASVGYLDTMRVLRFLDGMETLREQGKTFENSPQDYKDVADMVNTFTGRASLGKAEQIAEPLSKLFFSPRNWASAFKTGTPYAFYHFGKMTPTARKMALSDYSKFVGLTTSAVALAAYGLGQDNDEETSVELDPRSIDFMKVKLGNRHIDPWGGMQQQVVFSARVVADMIADIAPQYSDGGYKDYKGNIMRLGIGHKTPTKQELAMRVVVNKLGPSAALFNKYMSSHLGKDGGRIDQFGNPLNASSILEESSHPIFWGTVADLYKDDPSALNGLLAFYSFFGGGVNVYQGKKKK